MVLLLATSVQPSTAQTHETIIQGALGVAFRSAGDVDRCCGPYQSHLERPKAIWFGGSLTKILAGPVAVESEVTWAREPEYKAYVDGLSPNGAPPRGYRAENQVTTMTAAGLIRLRAWKNGIGSAYVVGGLGWVHERRASHLTSIVFRPGPEPLPTFIFDLTDARNLLGGIVGVDVEGSTPHYSVLAQCRFHNHFGSEDPKRPDLELGRQMIRLGLAVRRSF